MPACTPVSRDPTASASAPGCCAAGHPVQQRGDHLAQPVDVGRGPVAPVDHPYRRRRDRPEPGPCTPGRARPPRRPAARSSATTPVGLAQGHPRARLAERAGGRGGQIPVHESAPCPHRTRGRPAVPLDSPGTQRSGSAARERSTSSGAAAGGHGGRDAVQAASAASEFDVASATSEKASSRPSASTATPGERVDPGQGAGLGPHDAGGGEPEPVLVNRSVSVPE